MEKKWSPPKGSKNQVSETTRAEDFPLPLRVQLNLPYPPKPPKNKKQKTDQQQRKKQNGGKK